MGEVKVITIADFSIIPSGVLTHIIHYHMRADCTEEIKHKGTSYSDVDLVKFRNNVSKEQLKEQENDINRLIGIFGYNCNLTEKEVHDIFINNQDPIFKEIFEVLKITGWSQEQREAHLKFENDRLAWEAAWKQKQQEDREKGFIDGFNEGCYYQGRISTALHRVSEESQKKALEQALEAFRKKEAFKESQEDGEETPGESREENILKGSPQEGGAPEKSQKEETLGKSQNEETSQKG
jgi:hypothetical protein